MKQIILGMAAMAVAPNVFALGPEYSRGGGTSAEPMASVNLAVDFNVAECQATSSSCVGDTQISQFRSIPLNCEPQQSGGTWCTGSWTGSVERGGVSFVATIDVTQTTDGGGRTSCSMSASIGSILNSYVPTSIQVFPGKDCSIADTVRFSGSMLLAPGGRTRYLLPSLMMGPLIPADQISWMGGGTSANSRQP